MYLSRVVGPKQHIWTQMCRLSLFSLSPPNATFLVAFSELSGRSSGGAGLVSVVSARCGKGKWKISVKHQHQNEIKYLKLQFCWRNNIKSSLYHSFLNVKIE